MILNDTSMRLPRIFLAVFLFVALIIPVVPYTASAAAAQELSIKPVVIDEKSAPRDILKETITIINTSNRKLQLYPAVNNVRPADGEEAFESAKNSDDLTDSLANWIELSRGVIELGPGEEKAVPFVIRINQNAIAGSYHATISFSDGSTRDEAEAKPALASLTVNLEVKADIKEIMQLNTFTTDNVVFTGDDVLFKYQLQNIGNQELQPKGEIRIYDRKGAEVASIEINNEGKTVSPDNTAQLASVWSAVSGFGKYKALLDVDYGKSQVASVHDTIYFWVIPWKQLLGISIVSLLAVIFLALYFHQWIEERHFGKLATAGIIKAEALLHWQTAPPKPIIPVPESVERAKAAVQESVQEKKAIFDRFKRRGFTPTPAEAKPPVVLAAAPAPVRTSASSGTIDLKQMWQQQQATPTITEQHVINLKK
jgi:hypothetical protein